MPYGQYCSLSYLLFVPPTHRFVILFSDVVNLNVTLQYEGTFVANLSGSCASDRQLKDYIKPLIRRKFGSELMTARPFLGIRMYCSRDRNWSSPAKLFQAWLQQTNSFPKVVYF